MTTVLIVEDQTMFRDGLAKLISENTEMTVIGKVTNGLEAYEYYEDNDNIDVVVMDYRMPVLDGILAMRKILQYDPNANIVMLSMHADKEYVLQSFLTGAKAVISKSEDIDKLIEGIRAAAQGKHYLLDGQAALLIDSLQKTNFLINLTRKTEESTSDKLTEMEIKILKLMAQERTSNEIGDELDISARTVEAHRRNMMIKTKTKNVAGLIMYGVKEGLINHIVLNHKSPG